MVYREEESPGTEGKSYNPLNYVYPIIRAMTLVTRDAVTRDAGALGNS